MSTPELQLRINEALDILKMIKKEIPRTMGDFNINILYEDICTVINKLEGATDGKKTSIDTDDNRN
jgi:hypothetical protein